MNNQLTEIAFVLDRSGSMASIARAAITGFNAFLRDQQAAAGQARLTLVLFDDEYLVPADHLPIDEVVPLNTRTYVPRNGTALLDAIGETIDRIGKRLAATPEADRPGKVMFAILTDGLENMSTRYTAHELSRMIRHQTDVYQWEFLYLGANQDAIATAARLQISAANAATFDASPEDTRFAVGSISTKMRSTRSTCTGAPMTAEEKHAAAASMSVLLAEAKAKEQGKGKI